MIYFDNAATTPIDEAVRKVMCPYFAEKYGNPSSIYAIGREAKDALETAREQAAELLGAKPREIIFTSGATEANNLAVKGVFFYASQKLNVKPHVITSAIEHHCVLDSVKYLAQSFGAEVTYVGVNKEGLVDPSEVAQSIKENTILVSVMAGNNEVGSLQPIKQIGEVVKKAKSARQEAKNPLPLIFHTDAVQAFQYSDLRVDDLGVDMLSLTAHKFYGPKGVGLIYVRSGVPFLPQQQGGAQEKGRRAGTENVPYVLGMVKAMVMARENQAESAQKTADLRDYLIKKVTQIPEVDLLGPVESNERLPHIAAFIFKRIEGESILINLDMLGIAASSGSACTSGSLEPSHVTKAMGYSDLEAHGAVRFSLGKFNEKEEVDELIKHLPGIVEKLRAMSPIE